MDRKKIIINEIEYWKKSRLLPEHYCDFLLTLYSEGDYDTKIAKNKKQIQWLLLLSLIISLSIFGLTFLVIYFTEFSSLLQMTILSFFILILFGLGFYMKKFSKSFIDLYVSLGALLAFLSTVHLVDRIFNQPSAVIVAVVTTCLIWIIVGKLYKFKYLLISGIIGLVILVFFYFL